MMRISMMFKKKKRAKVKAKAEVLGIFDDLKGALIDRLPGRLAETFGYKGFALSFEFTYRTIKDDTVMLAATIVTLMINSGIDHAMIKLHENDKPPHTVFEISELSQDNVALTILILSALGFKPSRNKKTGAERQQSAKDNRYLADDRLQEF